MRTSVLLLVLFLGIGAGSFLNGMILRIAQEEKLLARRRCPVCGTPYEGLSVIMLAAYLTKKTQCPVCGNRRQSRELMIELLNALLWLCCLLIFRDRSPIQTLVGMAVSSAYLCIAFFDMDTMSVPDAFPALLLGFGAISMLDAGTPHFGERILGFLFGGGFFLLCYSISFVLKKRDGLDWGDVKLMAAGGFLLGWQDTFMAILFAALTAAIVLVGILLKKGNKQKNYPFAPFLAAGSVVALMVGEPLLKFYFGLFQFR